MRIIEPLQTLQSRFMYAFADSVYDAVEGTEEIRSCLDDDELFEDLALNGELLVRPHRYTALHHFISSVCKIMIEYVAYDAAESATEYFADLFATAGLRIPRWLTPERASNHRPELYKLACKAIDSATPSIFFILFSDRQFLHKFQTRLAEHISRLNLESHAAFLKRDGVLRRSSIPLWLKQGVFYRDRGRCQQCLRDLSGLMQPVADIHLDHIVSLATGGSNDPTNFQLLCSRCNIAKGARRLHRAPVFAPYWEID